MSTELEMKQTQQWQEMADMQVLGGRIHAGIDDLRLSFQFLVELFRPA